MSAVAGWSHPPADGRINTVDCPEEAQYRSVPLSTAQAPSQFWLLDITLAAKIMVSSSESLYSLSSAVVVRTEILLPGV